MKLGSTISRLRQEHGWTHAELAEKLGMHPNHVGRWEKNIMRPRTKTLAKLAELFNVELEELTATENEISSRISQKDPELAELILQIPSLDDEERSALRLFLHSLVTCKQLELLTLRRKSQKIA